jgi:cell wall-associated NlpC family hydrolase
MAMGILSKSVTAVLFWGISLCVCPAQRDPRQAGTQGTTRQAASGNRARSTVRTLTADDGLAVISAALDPKVRRYSGHDCSHLVHAIYERAGFRYAYSSSDDLYAGVERFQRVTHPQPGDLVVWRGHAGIVVRPSRHVFFSFKSAGPGIDDYESPYWTSRGQARFYRYVKSEPCTRCAAVSTTFGRPGR